MGEVRRTTHPRMTLEQHCIRQAELRAVHAERAVADERTRADALRRRLDSVQAALRDAEELRRADEARRRALGLWARLWEAAWL